MNNNKQEIGYTCPATLLKCDDECCVSPEQCHAKESEKLNPMIDKTQKMIEQIENLQNENATYKAGLKDLYNDYAKLLKAFNELLDVHLEMREKFGFGEFVQDYKYDWIDKAGLTDMA